MQEPWNRSRWPIVLALLAAACGSSPSSPSPSAAIGLTATPNPVSSHLCTGCGAGSTDREVTVQLTIQETGGVAVTVDAVAVSLRETGSNAVIAAGEFDGSGVRFFAGTERIPANGSIVLRDIGAHYAAVQAGKAATLTLTVRVRDDRGATLSRDISVAVTAT